MRTSCFPEHNCLANPLRKVDLWTNSYHRGLFEISLGISFFFIFIFLLLKVHFLVNTCRWTPSEWKPELIKNQPIRTGSFWNLWVRVGAHFLYALCACVYKKKKAASENLTLINRFLPLAWCLHSHLYDFWLFSCSHGKNLLWASFGHLLFQHRINLNYTAVEGTVEHLEIADQQDVDSEPTGRSEAWPNDYYRLRLAHSRY